MLWSKNDGKYIKGESRLNPSIWSIFSAGMKVYQRGITIESQLADHEAFGAASISKGNHD